MLAAKNNFERAAVNDPAFTFCPLPSNTCRLVIPELAGLLGLTAAAVPQSAAVLSRAELTTLPPKKKCAYFDDRVVAHAAGQDR